MNKNAIHENTNIRVLLSKIECHWKVVAKIYHQLIGVPNL